ncbi:hypothetical protein ABPG72_011702 [Tetrahymena utriculariae]
MYEIFKFNQDGQLLAEQTALHQLTFLTVYLVLFQNLSKSNTQNSQESQMLNTWEQAKKRLLVQKRFKQSDHYQIYIYLTPIYLCLEKSYDEQYASNCQK